MRWFWQKKPRRPKPDLQYGDPTHAQFNAELEQRSAPPDKLRDLDAPWLKPDTQLRLPQMRLDFEASQDLEAADRAQTQIRKSQQDNSEHGSHEKEQDQPKPELKPKGELRRRADQAVREQTYLSKIRDEVMEAAQAEPEPVSSTKSQTRMRMYAKQ